MTNASLLKSERAAKQVTYRTDFKAIGELIRYLIDDCCQSDARVVACCVPAAQPKDCCGARKR